MPDSHELSLMAAASLSERRQRPAEADGTTPARERSGQTVVVQPFGA
jgi:hypothetical protein